MSIAALQGSPRQAGVVKFLQDHPGATLNEVFHGLRERENGVTYETVRTATLKLIAKGLVRKDGNTEMYCCPLFLTSSVTAA